MNIQDGLDALVGMTMVPNIEAEQLRARIRALEAALQEARKWIGDGEFSDGLDRGHWTPEYAAVVDLIDRTLPQSETKGDVGG